MAEGAKRAHADLNINIDGPREELDVVTERPRDLSPAMELEVNRNKSLVDALDHLGNIADNANDLNRTINAYDWDVDYKDRSEQMKIEHGIIEETAQLNLFNEVSATKVKMIKDIENAKEAARNSGDGNVLEAAQGAMDGYKDAFSDSLEGSKMWSQVYNSTYAHETQNGILSDFEIAQAKAIHNINQIQNEIFRNVTMGTLDVDSGMKKLLVDTEAMKGHIPNQKYIEMMDQNYNQLVLAKALNLAKVANGSNATEVANTIRNLINQYGKKEYACSDGQGKPLTDENGNPITYQATLTPATVEELLRTAQSYENKVSAAGTGGGTKTFEHYKKHVGGEDLEKHGFSEYLTFSTTSSARKDYEDTMEGIKADPNLTPKQKLDRLIKVSDYYNNYVMPAVAVYECSQLNPNARSNYKKLQQYLNKLDKDLMSNQSMIDYSISFDLDGGGTFELKPQLDYTLMSTSSPEQAAKNTWKAIRDSMRRTLEARNTSDFLYGTNKDFNAATNAASAVLDRANLLSTSNGKSWINNTAITEGVETFKDMGYAYSDAVGKSGLYSPVSSTLLNKFMSEFTNCVNPKQQNDYTRAVATILINSGHSGLLMPHDVLKTKSDEEKRAFNELQKEMYLSAPNLSGIRAMVTKSSMQGTGYYTTEAAQNFLDTKGLKGKQLIGDISKLLKDEAVPAGYRESMMATLANVAVAYAVTDSLKGSMHPDEQSMLYQGDLKSALKLIVTSNFVKLDSPYMKTKVHVGNPALLQGKEMKDYGKQVAEISSLTTDVCDNLYTSLKATGRAVSKSNITADFNAENGRIELRVAGQGLGLSRKKDSAFSTSISVPYRYMEAKPHNYSAAQWKSVVSDYISTSAVLSYMATGPVKESVYVDPITKNKITSLSLDEVKAKINPNAYTTKLTPAEQTQFNKWVAGMKAKGAIHKDDKFQDYDMQGFWKYEVLNNTKYANSTAQTHFPDTYKKPNHDTFSIHSKYAVGENLKLAGSWSEDNKTFIRPNYSSKPDDAIKLLSVMQSDDFLTKYAETVSSGGKIGVSPAPRYVKEIFKQSEDTKAAMYTPFTGVTEVSIKRRRIPEAISTMLDYAYSKATTYKKIDLTVNKPLSYDMQGLNYSGVISVAHANGFTINRDYDAKQYGNYVSNHSKGMALDFGVNSNNMIDNVTGLIKVSSMQNFTNMITKNPAYKNRVNCILTSRPELLENKPEYAAYAPFRALKNSQGKPLFRDAREVDKRLKLDHTNHFHVDFKEQVVDANHRDFKAAYSALASDMSNTAARSNTPIDNTTARALLETFGSRFNTAANAKGQFGMANLTKAEYEMLGLTGSSVNDPTLQARALANRFQAYANALGNTDLAIYALAGSKFKSSDGKIYTIQEILNSGKIAGINGQSYTVAAPTKNGKLDTAAQAAHNAAYRKYKNALKTKR